MGGYRCGYWSGDWSRYWHGNLRRNRPSLLACDRSGYRSRYRHCHRSSRPKTGIRWYWTGRYFKAMSSQVAAAGTRAPRRCAPDCSPSLLLRHTTVGGMAPSTSCSAGTVCPVLLRDVFVCSPSPSGGKATPLSSWGRFHSVRNTSGHSVSSQGGGILCRRLR